MGDLHCSDLMKWDEKENCGLVLFHLLCFFLNQTHTLTVPFFL